MWDYQGKDGELSTLEAGRSLDGLYPVDYYYYYYYYHHHHHHFHVMDEMK
jgi:hypothetical protein